MRQPTSLIAAIAVASTMLAAPAIASTDAGSYTGHQADCLKLLFTDPAAHEAQCGGPFVVVPSTIPTSGSGAGCQVHITFLVPSRPILLAGNTDPCCTHCCRFGMLTDQPSLPEFDRGTWKLPVARELLAVC